MKIKYFKPDIGKEEINEVVNTLKSGWLTSGPKVELFEKNFKEYVGCSYALAVNSCTSALQIALKSIGVSYGDEVITTPMTFVSTGNVIVNLGAKPIFVDIEKNTHNIDPKKIEEKISKKTKAILIVHYGGHSCNLKEIEKIAKKHNLKIVEDAAHAIGSEYYNNKIGNSNNIVCFSFYTTKNMTSGEGGMITVNNLKLYNKMKILRNNGLDTDSWNRQKNIKKRYALVESGFKSNMSDILASIGICQLKKLDSFNSKRRKIANYYLKKLKKLDLILPVEREKCKTNYHLFPIILKNYNRDKFIKKLGDFGIETSIHFFPLHLQPFYKNKFKYKKGDFEESEFFYNNMISLPIYPDMTLKEVKYVCDSIKKILNEGF